MYLNEVYFGNGAYRIGTAAATYFRKPASELTLAEGALLAAPIRAPGAYDPITKPDGALARRNLAIDRIVEHGMVSPAKAERVKARPLSLAEDAGPPEQPVQPFFVTYIQSLILDDPTGEFEAGGHLEAAGPHPLPGSGTRSRRSSRSSTLAKGPTPRSSR